MKRLFSIALAIAVTSASVSFTVNAQQNIAYFGVAPVLKLSYSYPSPPRRLGYLCLGVELMLGDVSYVRVAEHHEPLIKSIIVGLVGRQMEDKVRSITGREEVRKKIHKELTEKFQRETGNPLVRDVIYTRYQFNC